MTPEQQTELVGRYQSRMAKIADNVQSQAGKAWDALGSYNEVDIARLTEVSERLWVASRTQAVNTSSGFYSLVTDTASVGVNVAEVAGAPPSAAEAFRVTWKHMADGMPWEEAVAAGRAAFERSHFDAAHQAARYTGDVWERASGRQGFGWQRVLVGVSCEWCALVSTQVYRSAGSASFGHDHCDCAVVPMAEDPGKGWGSSVIERSRLATLYRETNIGDRLTASRRSSKTLTAADNAQSRSQQAMAEARRESDPERYERLLDRARTWDRKAQHLRVRAAQESAATADRPSTSTGYVDPDGRPVARPDA